MQNQKIISLLVVPLFYLGLTCLLPKKATAEIIPTGIQIGNNPIACDTDAQRCYTPQNGKWVYVGTLDEVRWHQSAASTCQSAINGNSFAATLVAIGGYACTIYGYSQEQNIRIHQTGNSARQSIRRAIEGH